MEFRIPDKTKISQNNINIFIFFQTHYDLLLFNIVSLRYLNYYSFFVKE